MHWKNAHYQNATAVQTQNADDAAATSQGKEQFIEQIADAVGVNASALAGFKQLSTATLKLLAADLGPGGGEMQGNAAEYPGGELGVDAEADGSLTTNETHQATDPAAYPDGEL